MELFEVFTHLLALAVGALVGVGLGRRSSGANAAYDRAINELNEVRAKYNALREKNKQ